jgi:hypothetical protein
MIITKSMKAFGFRKGELIFSWPKSRCSQAKTLIGFPAFGYINLKGGDGNRKELSGETAIK